MLQRNTIKIFAPSQCSNGVSTLTFSLVSEHSDALKLMVVLGGPLWPSSLEVEGSFTLQRSVQRTGIDSNKRCIEVIPSRN